MLPVKKYWENPAVLHVNCEKPRAYFIPYESYNNAVKGVRGTSSYYQSLYGVWNFKYYPSVYEVEDGFIMRTSPAMTMILSPFLPTGKCMVMTLQTTRTLHIHTPVILRMYQMKTLQVFISGFLCTKPE